MIWAGEIGDTWQPDLSTPEGVREAIRILGAPMVKRLMSEQVDLPKGAVVKAFDVERKTVSIEAVE